MGRLRISFMRITCYHTMNIKSAIIILLLTLLAPAAQGQSIRAYAAAGAIASQIEGDELKGFGHWGFAGGMGASVNFGNQGIWSLAVETGYSSRGVRNHNHNSQNYYNIDMDLHYVDIPLTLFFRDPYGGMKVGLGGVFSRLVAQPHGSIDYRPTFFSPDTADMSFLKNDIALAGELRFTVWQGLMLSVRCQYSLFPVKRDWSFTQGSQSWSNHCYNSAVTFRLLYQFGEPEKFKPRTSNRKNTYQPQPNVRINRKR